MLRYLSPAAWRHFTKNRVSAILNITGLTIGIATCLVIAIWAERELSFDAFHTNSQAKFRIWNTFTSEAESFSQAPSGVALGSQLARHIPEIKSSCRVFKSSFKVEYDTQINFERNVIIADSTFFSFFNFPIIEGPRHHLLTDLNEVILTRSAAERYFGSAEAALNKMMLLDDSTVTVRAVAENPPANSHIQFEFVVPFEMLRQYALNAWHDDIDNMWVGGWPHVYVELYDASQAKSVEQKINHVVAEHSKKEWADNKMSYQYFIQPITDIHLRSALRYDSANNGNMTTVRVFIAVAILVLLLACFNYINLTTATSVKRAKEISLRKVVGAAKIQLMRQFFLETLSITMLAVIVGLALTQIILPYFSNWMGQPYKLPFDLQHMGALIAFVLVVTFLSGMYPSIVLSSYRPIASLRGKFYGSPKGQLFRKGLVVLQFSISTILLVSILTVNQQMSYINSKPLGYEAHNVITIDFQGDAQVLKNYAAIRNSLLAMPSIEQTSLHNGNVVGGLGNGWTPTIDNSGKEITTSIYGLNGDANYFNTYKMKILAGRTFIEGSADSTKAVLVNEAAVKNLGWGSPEQALGKPFGHGDDVRYVVGVIENFHFENLHAAVQPLLIRYARNGSSMSLRIQANHTREAIDHLEKVWANVVPDVPLRYAFLEETLQQQYSNEQKMGTLFYVFACLSFLIAGLGLFGLSTFMIRQRLQEISIRKVLGSSISGIVVLLTRDFTKLVLISIAAALPVGWFLMQEWLASFTYHTELKWPVFLIASLIPISICLITTSTQAIKAALINAAKTLRSE